MEERLRFTGENPPVQHWLRYPNWENAFDEEDFPDQDETTLRPADNQDNIDDDISFTAGEAVLANGRNVPALLGLLSSQVDWIYVYPNPDEDVCWVLSFHMPSKSWKAMSEDWFLQSGGLVHVPVGDSSVFPLHVTSRLPLQQTRKNITLEIADPARS
jgi:hypothetical protein